MIALREGASSFFFVKDQLASPPFLWRGSVRAVMNSSNGLSSLYHYTPFGDSWATVLNRPSDYQFTDKNFSSAVTATMHGPSAVTALDDAAAVGA